MGIFWWTSHTLFLIRPLCMLLRYWLHNLCLHTNRYNIRTFVSCVHLRGTPLSVCGQCSAGTQDTPSLPVLSQLQAMMHITCKLEDTNWAGLSILSHPWSCWWCPWSHTECPAESMRLWGVVQQVWSTQPLWQWQRKTESSVPHFRNIVVGPVRTVCMCVR